MIRKIIMTSDSYKLNLVSDYEGSKKVEILNKNKFPVAMLSRQKKSITYT